MAKKTLITSALPYANGSIHIGHLVEYIQTDVFVRFLKSLGEDAVYVCADDTHGTPISIKSEQLGISPEELIARFQKEHLEDFNAFHIEFDSYYSTNSEENRHYADQIFNALKEKGLIYTKEIESLYDPKAKRFLPDRYVKGECPKCGAQDQYGDVCEKCNATYKPIELVNPYSTVSGEKPIQKQSKHYFFKLSSLSEKLDKWLTTNKSLQPEIVNYVRNWIKEGLQDWDISRDGPYFGFNIPGETDKYYYVWLDAPIGYIASTQNYLKASKKDAEKEYWKNKDARIIHFIGKDITYFHFLFWPAMLTEAGFRTPDDIVVHGFLTVNGEKMSKSRGTFLTAKDFLEKGRAEHLRYYYASNLSRSMTDIDLNLEDYKERINNELVSNIANFVYRVLSFTEKNFESKLGKLPVEKELIKEANESYEKIRKHYESVQFRQAVSEILKVSSLGNKYLQDNAPWKLLKTDKARAHEVLTISANLVKNLAIVIAPILPEYFKSIEKQLGVKDLKWSDIGFNLENHKLGKSEIFFEKIEKLEFGKAESPLNLKVAIVESCESHPDASKLFVVKIDLGGEKRTIVAGLRAHYDPEQLVGKHLIVVTNLEPAKLRGVKSEAMLLACDNGEAVGVLHIPDAPAGTQVVVEGLAPGEKIISFTDFQKLKLEAKSGKAYQDGKALLAGNYNIIIDHELEGKIR